MLIEIIEDFIYNKYDFIYEQKLIKTGTIFITIGEDDFHYIATDDIGKTYMIQKRYCKTTNINVPKWVERKLKL
jgi:hypothetical protein